MRLSVVLLIVALAGVLGGGALIGLPGLGACLIFDSLCVGVWALLRDDGSVAPPAVARIGRSVEQVLDEFRAAS